MSRRHVGENEFEINFGYGVDQDRDDTLVNAPLTTKLSNVSFRKPGVVQCRDAYTSFSASQPDSTQITSGSAVMIDNKDKLIINAENNYWQYERGLKKSFKIGHDQSGVFCQTRSEILQSKEATDNLDTAFVDYGEGFYCVVYRAQGLGEVAATIQNTYGEVVFNGFLPEAAGSTVSVVRVVSYNNKFVCVYRKSSKVYISTYDVTDPASGWTDAHDFGTANSFSGMDCVSQDSGVVIFWASASAGTDYLAADHYDPDTQTKTKGNAVLSDSAYSISAYRFNEQGTDRAIAFYQYNGSHTAAWDISTTTPTALSASSMKISGSFNDPDVSVTWAPGIPGSGSVKMLSSRLIAGNTEKSVSRETQIMEVSTEGSGVLTNGTGSAYVATWHGITPMAEGFTDPRDPVNVYLPFNRNSEFQTTNFLVRLNRTNHSDRSVVGVYNHEKAGYDDNFNVSRTPYNSGSREHIFAAYQVAKVRTEASGSIQTEDRLALFTSSFPTGSQHQYVAYKNSVLVAGSRPVEIAHGQVQPMGLLFSPERQQGAPASTTGRDILLTATSQSGGNLSTGTYRYVFVWEYTTPTGDIYRSQPSIPAEVSVTTPGENTVECVITSSVYDPRDQAAMLVGYRTQANGSIYYRFSSTDPSDYTNEFEGCCFESKGLVLTDKASDESLTDNELLYTEFGLLPNYPPPPTNDIEYFDNRLWVISEDDGRLWYSKEKVEEEAWAFNPQLVVETTEKPTAIKALDSALYVFWENRIGFIRDAGGYDSQGGGQNYPPIVMLPSTVGCTNKKSIVAFSGGVMFEASTGDIWMIDRGNAVIPAGEKISGEDYHQIVGATDLPKYQELRFVTDSAKSLVFDYRNDQWFTHTIVTGAMGSDRYLDEHLIIYPGAVTGSASVYTASFGNGSTEFWHQSENTYLTTVEDGGQGSSTAVRFEPEAITGWFALNGKLGRQRIKRVNVLGDFSQADGGSNRRSPCAFLGFDYSGSFDNITSSLGLRQDFSLISGITSSTEYVTEERMHMAYQKCTSMRIKFTDFRSLKLMKIQWEPKRGTAKLHANFADADEECIIQS